MAGKSSQANNRGSNIFGYSVSGKGKDFHTSKNGYVLEPQTGMDASGGTITNYTEGPISYRVHTFTSSNTFVVNTLSANIPGGDDIEYLVVGGGGSGGQNLAGGGGAGGLRTNLSGHPIAAAPYTVSTTNPYTVVVGGGGASQSSPEAAGNNGIDSEFYPTPVSYPSTERIRAVGGGGGAGGAGGANASKPGGSGGGSPGYGYPQTGLTPAYVGAPGNTTDPNHPQRQGYAGGQNGPGYGNNYIGGGGGGAGGIGNPGDRPGGSVADHPTSGNGGIGLQVNIDNNNYYWAGGGGAGAYTNSDANRHAGDGGIGGGGGGASNGAPTKGIGGGSALNSGGDGTPGPTTGPSSGGSGGENTGGGGGSCGHNAGPVSGAGGKGIVIIRYKMSTY